MKKCKVLVFSAVAVAAVVAIVLSGKSPDEAAQNEAALTQDSMSEAASAKANALPHPAVAAVSSTNQTPTVRGTLPYVLTSKTPFAKPLRLAVEAMGAKTVSVVSRNALLVEADERARARLSADGRFDEITEFLPSSKIQPELAALIAGGAKSVDVSLVALAAADRQIVINCLKHGGGEMLEGCINEGETIRAKLPADLVATLATRGDVRWMERFEYPKLMNDIAVTNVAMNVQEVWNTYGLTGAGQVVSTSDSGIDTGDLETMHKDLQNRVKGIKIVDGCVPTDVNGHGTHTAGSIVGDGTMSTNQIRGTAHGADLYAWFCSKGDSDVYTPTTMAALYTANGEWNAHIHSASWGAATGGEYDSRCVNHDEWAWKNPEFLPVFSAGNEGSGRRTIGSPAAAKNVLAVGATQNLREGHDGGWGNGDPDVTAKFSSRGPCKDGRTKPDISAPGVGILSTRSRFADYSYGVHSNTNYAYDSGTSMSCPLTAGAVALVRQWLVEQKGFADEDGKRPTAALMKAVIMGGAKGAATPNNDQGWGRVDLAETLFPTNGRAVKLIDRIPFAQGFVTNIVIETTNAAPLDVQLVWIDYPGSASASQFVPKLVNDLDLTVSAHIPGEPTARYGNGGEEPDTLNNAESIRITNAIPTKYVITVDCKTILHDYTEGGAAALYIRGAFDPAAEVEEPACVHLKQQNRNFISLDRALKAVTNDNETVEILDWVNFDKSVTLTNTCMIAATNANAAAAYVVRIGGAPLTIADGAKVTLSNVVFASSSETLAVVEGGGRLKVGPDVDFGIAYDKCVVIATADAGGFELAGELTNRILFACSAATSVDEVFGSYSCDPAIAEKCAGLIVCTNDIDRETRGGVGPDNKLVWRHANVPMDEAAAYFVGKAGNTNTYFRMVKALNEFKAGYDAGQLSEFIARKDGGIGVSFNVIRPLTMRGEGEPQPVLTAANTAGFKVGTGGALTVTNLVFTGYDAKVGNGFIGVNGGSLTLEAGATLDGIIGRVDEMSGVVDLRAGSVTMRPESAIVNCKALGGSKKGGKGGAIYVDYDKCTLNLEGGTITNCYASISGGGVYVYDWNGYVTKVNVSGPLSVDGNASAASVRDNVCLRSVGERQNFKIVNALSGKVGVHYGSASSSENGEGKSFVVNAAGVLSKKSLRSFSNDVNADLVAVTNAAGMLEWAKNIWDDPRQCDEEDAAAKLVAGSEVTFWWKVSDALNEATNNCVVEVMTDADLEESVTIGGTNVTLRSVAGNPYGLALYRDCDAQISVGAGYELVVTNLDFCGTAASTVTFLDVCGGKLSLIDADIFDIDGEGVRNANAVTVWNRGSLTMDGGSQIDSCHNYSLDPTGLKDANAGAGGGILIDNATAHFRNMYVSNCSATKGGGVFVCNDSSVYVSGLARILNNATLGGESSNLKVSDNSELIVEDELAGRIYMTPKALSLLQPSDTNVIAQVSASWHWSTIALTNSAANFKSDVSRDVGVAVTNGTKALIVWCGAVKNGVYTNVENNVAVEYVLAGKLPHSEQQVSGYQLTFGTANAFENDPVVEITKIVNAEGGVEVTVLVKDGDAPVTVDADKVAALFEATSDVGNWKKTLKLTVENATQNADKSVTYTVKPEDDPAMIFIRLAY